MANSYFSKNKVIDLKKYTELNRTLDNILLDKKSAFITYSISWLHLIKEHPIFLKRYEILFKYSYFLIIFLKLIYNICCTTFYVFFSILKSKKNIYSKYKKVNDINYLFISHLVDPSVFKKKSDFYFGDLPFKLIENKKKVAFIYFEQKNIKVFNSNESTIPIFIFQNKTDFLNTFKIYFSLFSEFFRLINRSLKSNNLFQFYCYIYSSIEVLSLSTFKNLIRSKELESLINILKPKVVITTFEGHAYERLFYCLINRSKKNIISAGYQSAALLKLQHSINRDLLHDYNPKYIFYPSALCLKNSSKKMKSKKIVVGSNKLYFLKKNWKRNINELNKNSILVLPEGLLIEEVYIINFCLKYCSKYKDSSFILRLHPLSDLFKIKQKLRITNFPHNITLSNNANISDDFKRCEFAIYRGSSAIIQAGAAGLFPIYLKQKNEISIDPLYQIKKNVSKIINVNQLNSILYLCSNRKKLIKSSKIIVNYCNNYYTDTVIKKIIRL